MFVFQSVELIELTAKNHLASFHIRLPNMAGRSAAYQCLPETGSLVTRAASRGGRVRHLNVACNKRHAGVEQ